MTISSTAMLTSLKILLAAFTNRETAPGEGNVDAVLKSWWGESQDVCILFLLRHVMRQHDGRGGSCDLLTYVVSKVVQQRFLKSSKLEKVNLR